MSETDYTFGAVEFHENLKISTKITIKFICLLC